MSAYGFVIRYEDGAGRGRGHAQRMMRLAQVLEPWTEVDCRPFSDDEDWVGASAGRHLILDLAENDNARLVQVRRQCARLIVFVGVGHTIDVETAWLADCIVYQNCRRDTGLPSDLAKILVGPKWLMTDPVLANAWNGRIPNTIGLYCGAGWPKDYEWRLRLELSRLLPGISLVPELGSTNPDWQLLACKTKMVCTSMGMAALEAVAAGVPTVVFSVDAEHAEDADSAKALGLLRAAPFGSTPEQVAALAAQFWHAPKPPPRDSVDGFGLYRVARELLRL